MFTLSKSKELSFNIVFGGENEILLDDLLPALDGLSNLIGIVTSKVEPNAKVELKFKKSSQGSFDVELLMFLTGNFISLISNTEDPIKIVKTLVELIKFKTFLQGESPAKVVEGDDYSINVENFHGDTLKISPVVYNVFQYPSTNENFRKMFSNNRESLSIAARDNGAIRVDKSEYEYLVADVKIDECSQVVEGINRIILHIKKPDLLGNSKWEFRHKEKSIKATIEDKDFLLKIQDGQISINSHTYCDCDLSFRNELDSIGNLVRQEYKLLKVYDVKVADDGEQTSFC
ncbi:MAG: hypothetical protein WBI17_09715 [Clostridiaceae bacterium]